MAYRYTLFAALAGLALGAPAQGSTSGWSYFGDYHLDTGVPTTLLQEPLPPGLLNEIYARLPEGLDINQNRDEKKLLTDNLGANVHLLDDAEITLIAIGGNTGFTNSVGFFTYPADAAPTTTAGLDTKIVFPNFAAMVPGAAVKLGTFKAGTAMGFTIVSDGWQQGQGMVNPNPPVDKVFYSIRDLNPETPSNDGNSHLNAHTILLSKPESNLLILGFEDAFRHPSNKDKDKPLRSDDDFNDVLIAIKISPVSKVDLTQVEVLDPAVGDSDGDGIRDDIDAFPTDPERAGRRFYPSATGFGYLAFEDNWPSKGDFDMNDVVMAYRAIETLNARNEVTDLKLIYEIRARGGSSNSGFGIHLPGIPRERIKTAQTTLKVGQQAPVALPTETGQTDAVFILSPKVNDLTQTGERWPCAFFNTVNSCVRRAPVPLVAEIHFTQPLSAGQLGNAPYNPFIYRSHTRGREVHLVDHPPTARADLRLFGTGDDASNPAAGRYYRTANDLPWALDVPESWRYPAEWNDIADAYPSIAPWAVSGGQSATDWYLNAINEKLVFQP